MATAIAESRMSPETRLVIGQAGSRDDTDLCRMLRDGVMEGWIRLTFEREPSFFSGVGAEGMRHVTTVVRDPENGTLVMMGTRAVRKVFLNGRTVHLGYMSQLRIHPRYRRHIRGLVAAFRSVLAGRRDDECPFHLTSVLTNNERARRVLERRLPGMPTYHPWTDWSTFTFAPRSLRVHRMRGLEIITAAQKDMAELSAFLRETLVKFQSAPTWDMDALDLPGLRPADFFLAVRDSRIVGCAALWDQSSFKQIVVKGYRSPLGAFRSLLNLVRPITGQPWLPTPGQALRQAFVSHLAVENDNVDVFYALLGEVMIEARKRGLAFLLLGCSPAHSWFSVLKRTLKPQVIPSKLYWVCPEGIAPPALKPGILPWPEVAVL